MRVPFQTLTDYLEHGYPLDEFLDDFPSVTRARAVQAIEASGAALLRAVPLQHELRCRFEFLGLTHELRARAAPLLERIAR